MSDFSKHLLPEERLLISLCRLMFNEEVKLAIRDIILSISDWEKFIRLANDHGVIALCWFNIAETGYSGNIPKQYFEILHNGYLKSLARNIRIFDLLDYVLDIADEEEIKIVLIKGLALEKIIYGNRGLRQMNDLDILVRKEDAIKLRDHLLKNGFESQPIISPLHEKILPSYGKHLPEMYKNGLSVEIHFKLFDQKGNSLTRTFFDSSEPCALSSELKVTNLSLPSPLYHFIYLVKHLEKHESGGTSQFRLYSDLVILSSQYREKILKKDLFDYASTAGLEKALSEKLFLLNIFWGIDLSSCDLNIPEPIDKDKVIENFLHFLRHPKDMRTDDDSESLLRPMKEMENISHKFLFIIGYLFPSISFMKYRYKAHSTIKAILYYLVRWTKLIKLIFSGSL